MGFAVFPLKPSAECVVRVLGIVPLSLDHMWAVLFVFVLERSDMTLVLVRFITCLSEHRNRSCAVAALLTSADISDDV